MCNRETRQQQIRTGNPFEFFILWTCIQFLTINVFYRLLLGKSAIERSSIGSNVNRGLEMMSAIQRCPL